MIREFVVIGRPQGKQRPRFFRGRAYTPPETVAYEAKIRGAYLAAYPDAEPFMEDIAVLVNVYYANKVHADLDNVIKTLDGLNGIAWKDDKQIKEIHGYLTVNKRELPRMEIVIRPLTNETEVTHE